MPNTTNVDVKKMHPYILAAIPFLALFAYELATVLPHRPSAPDLVHGYTIAMGEGDGHKLTYVSAGDLALIMAPFFAALVINAIGWWRAGVFRNLFKH